MCYQQNFIISGLTARKLNLSKDFLQKLVFLSNHVLRLHFFVLSQDIKEKDVQLCRRKIPFAVWVQNVTVRFENSVWQHRKTKFGWFFRFFWIFAFSASFLSFRRNPVIQSILHSRVRAPFSAPGQAFFLATTPEKPRFKEKTAEKSEFWKNLGKF